jgi:hypothetical protein
MRGYLIVRQGAKYVNTQNYLVLAKNGGESVGLVLSLSWRGNNAANVLTFPASHCVAIEQHISSGFRHVSDLWIDSSGLHSHGLISRVD